MIVDENYWWLFKLVVDFDLGARLFKYQIFDGSAKTRITVYNSIYLIDFNTYVFGDSNQYLKIMKKIEAAGIENSLIVFMIKYGVLFLLISLVLYYQFIKKTFSHYKNFQKFILIVAFLIVGLSNNGLINPTVWGIYVIALHSFSTANFNKTYLNSRSKQIS